ncbi:hypothetical protein CRUP_025775 [Coryphaenoides rupestris]|nr:hypothetical protein CRUP_025775 [Coryphaenoides rupestris]
MEVDRSMTFTALSLTWILGLSGVWSQIQVPKPQMEVTKGQTAMLQASYQPTQNSDISANAISWTFTNTTGFLVLIISYTQDTISVGKSQFNGRLGFSQTMPSSIISLYINNTQEMDSGNFVCQVLAPTGGFSAQIKLNSAEGKPLPVYRWIKTNPTNEVFFSPMLTSNAGVIAGATVGSLVGFAFLVAFLFFLWKRNRDNEDEMANDIKEDAQAPKRVSWAKSGMGSDVISKNGTMSSISSSPHHKESFNSQQQPPSHHQQQHHLHHQHHSQQQQYPAPPPSDTASIITTTGSIAGYRPAQPRHHGGASTPTQYGAYNGNGATLPRDQYPDGAPQDGRGYGEHPNSGTLPLGHTERPTRLPQAQPLAQGDGLGYGPAQSYGHAQPALLPIPRPPAPPTSVISASNIARMGGVPIMVPAQNQAGSLV